MRAWGRSPAVWRSLLVALLMLGGFSATPYGQDYYAGRFNGGAITNPLLIPDGTAPLPGLAFANEPSSGLYRAGAGDVLLQVLGVSRIEAGPTFTDLRGTDGGAYFRVSSGAVQINSASLTLANGGTSKIVIPAVGATTGQLVLANGAANTGVGIDVATDGVIKFRDRATFTSDAAVQAGVFQTAAAWMAGVSGGQTYLADTAFPTRLRTSMAAPGSLANGEWWVESDTGALTGASGALKTRLNGNTVFVDPAIRRAVRVVGATAAQASVAAYPVGAADGSFEVSCNVLVTVATSHSFGCSVGYTDEGNTARTVFLDFATPSAYPSGSAAIINANGTIPYDGTVRHIRAKASTTITIATSGTFTTVTYNVEGIIKQTS